VQVVALKGIWRFAITYLKVDMVLNKLKACKALVLLTTLLIWAGTASAATSEPRFATHAVAPAVQCEDCV
jgi:hypothetical protein